MRRGQRKLHLLMWSVIGPLAIAGLILGITSRREMPTQEPPVADEAPQSNPPATEVQDK